MRFDLKSKVVLAFVLVCFFGLSGCTEQSGNETANTQEDTDTGAQTALTESITIDALSEYSIVRGDEAESEEVDAAVGLRNEIKTKLGIDVSITTDWYKEGSSINKPSEKEILVGDTNRQETIQFMSELKINDYGYAMIGKKLVICGKTPETTTKAVESFLNDLLPELPKDGFFFSGEMAYISHATYTYDDIFIGGVSINEYDIVYPEKASDCKMMASVLFSKVQDICGYSLEITSDRNASADKKHILIGNTSLYTQPSQNALSDNEYFFGADSGNVIIMGGNLMGVSMAINSFVGKLTDPASVSSDKKATVSLTSPQRDTFTMSNLSIMSFNILTTKPSEERLNRVTTIIQTCLPDSLGVQEATYYWMTHLSDKLGGYYSYVGEGRDGGTAGEFSAIFYAKDKLNVIESGTKWLSDTPDVVSKYSESSLNRIMTYALFEVKATGERYMHINTHLEHTSDAARKKQLKVIIDFISKIDVPILITGDFNFEEQTSLYYTMTSTKMSDSKYLAANSTGSTTFHNYGSSKAIIDFCYVTEGTVFVNKYAVIDSPVDGDYASDHHPVYVEFSLVK